MQLYQGTANSFIMETTRNKIAGDLSNAYFSYFGYFPSFEEKMSWQNSLRAIKDIFLHAGLNDQGISLEYFLPSSSKRLDCMVCGKNKEEEETALIIELKQWEKCFSCQDDKEVVTRIGGEEREMLHPSAQVKGYKDHLRNFVEVFYQKNPIQLDSCVYLHNYEYEKNDPILDKKFSSLIKDGPLFCSRDYERLTRYIKERVSYGEGVSTLEKRNKSRKKPSIKLLDEAYDTIRKNSAFVLLDEQQVVFDHVMGIIKKGFSDKDKKHVLIIKGGPGTGKSVIAMNLLGELYRMHKWAEYVTGSASFTESYKKAIGGVARDLFHYTNSYVQQVDTIDCLIVDEAHRLRERAPAGGYGSRIYSGKPQVQEIIDACHVAVFFVDDDQQVKPDEVGSSKYIREHALALGCDVWEEQLRIQFRCSGNDGFVRWIENTLGLHQTANVMLEKRDDYEFRICSSPEEMEEKLKEKMALGNTARIVSGFVFPWSKVTSYQDEIPNDVVIGNYKRPWNLKVKKDNLPSSKLWAYSPEGFSQIGCIYSVQGFEFDYIGVIFGNDIVYDLDQGRWVPKRENEHDGSLKRIKSDEVYLKLVKDVYRVLLSRGMKGCYVYFMDKDTERFVRSRILTD